MNVNEANGVRELTAGELDAVNGAVVAAGLGYVAWGVWLGFATLVGINEIASGGGGGNFVDTVKAGARQRGWLD